MSKMASHVVHNLFRRKRHFFARLRDGIAISDHQIKALAAAGAIVFDPSQRQWVPKPDVLEAFNAYYGTTGSMRVQG